MNDFAPFQNLYQQVKKTDPRLYEALNTISNNLQNLFNTINDPTIMITLTLAKITSGGKDGSISLNPFGRIIEYISPT